MYNSANGSGTPRRKERRVSILYRHTDAQQHCAGVEGLAVSTSNDELLSASRDSTVRRWSLSSGRPVCANSFEGHTDWVNAVVYAGTHVASCSNDGTVKLWSPTEGACVQTYQHHTDYVTCLVAVPQHNALVSAGLRSEVFWYDLESKRATALHPYSADGSGSSSGGSGLDGLHGTAGSGSDPGGAGRRGDKCDSIYAAAVSPDGAMVVVGTTEGALRCIDTRTQQKVFKLRSHTDNVRALLISGDGRLLLSGASDHTVRVWDLGQQRCIQTLVMHRDSVWALAADEGFQNIYSGGRDQQVYCTRLAQRHTELLLVEQQPVRALALTEDSRRLWVASTSSTINAYDVGPAATSSSSSSGQGPGGTAALPGSVGSTSRGRGGSISSRAFYGSSPAVRLRRHSFDPQEVQEAPSCSSPAVTIPGAPGLKHHLVLPDRRHILTQTTEGHVMLWGVLEGSPIRHYGQVNLAEQAAALWQPVDVPAWFTADTKLGQLAVHLEPPRCFTAEAYALTELNIPGAPDDLRINLGAALLRNAFRHWAAAYAKRYMSGAPLPNLAPGDTQPAPFNVKLPPAVMCSYVHGIPWRTWATAFTGEEQTPEDIPGWVADLVIKAQFGFVKELKSAFVLKAEEGSGLPALLQSKLNAPRILQVHKVMNYVVNKLNEMAVEVYPHEVGFTPDTQLPQDTSRRYLELTCNGLAVPSDMSIASVQKFLWKRSSEPVFEFRILNPAVPAPLPRLAPDA